MVQMLSHVLFHPHALQSLSADGCPTKRKCAAAFCYSAGRSYHFIFNFIHALIHSAGGESDVPLTETVVLPPTVEGDDPVTFTPDILTHRPHHRVTGSGPQKRHAVLQLHPATEKQQQQTEKHWIRWYWTRQVSQSHRVSSAFCLFLSEDRIKRGGALTASHRGHKTNASVH